MNRTVPRKLKELQDRRIVILGAGPTGLGAGYRLDELGLRNFTIFEQNAYAGGLATSFRDSYGFTWDVGGHVQFSHYEYYDAMLQRVMGDEWLLHERESWVFIRDRYVPYPFQNNIHFLPEAEKRACLQGLIEASLANAVEPHNFEEWVHSTFGPGIADLFMLPYNFKVWAYPPSELEFGWIGERVARPDVNRIIRNMADQRADTNWGPNNRFRFPARGGTGEIWRRVAATLPASTVVCNRRAIAVDTVKRRIRFSDGSSEPYDLLISTMPLDLLAAMVDNRSYRNDAALLRYSTVHVIGVGLKGCPPPHLKKKCWIYYPESNCPFYRLTVFSNYSPSHVPDPERQWSVMVEVSESPQKPVVRTAIPEAVIDGLLNARVIDSKNEVLTCWHHVAEHGYPTPFLGRDGVTGRLSAALEREAIFSRGRFGAWKYEVSNQDHSFMQGVELINSLALGAEEVTLGRGALAYAAGS